LEKNKEISGRFLENFRRLEVFPNYYDLQVKLNQKNPNADWTNGLFAESSLTSSYVSSLVKSLKPNSYPEGEGYFLETKFIDPKRVSSILNLLGVNWLINLDSEKKNLIATWKKQKETKYFNLEKVDGGNLFEVTKLRLVPVESNWNKTVEDWWLEKGQLKDLPYKAANKKLLSNNDQEGKVEIVNSNAQKTLYKLRVSSEKPVTVLAKLSYFPSWRVFQNGKQIPLYQAAPNLMLFSASGLVTLEYTTPVVQIVGYLLTLLGLFLTILLIIRKEK
jgi:hypothetical protein